MNALYRIAGIFLSLALLPFFLVYFIVCRIQLLIIGKERYKNFWGIGK